MLGSQVLQPAINEKAVPIETELLIHDYPIAQGYLKKLLAWTLIWAIILIGFIWVIDPYGVSPLKVKLNGINIYKPQRLEIDRLIKPIEVWRYQPKTIFIGTSRIHQSLDPAVLDGSEYAPAYNAAIPASTLSENAGHIEQFLKLDPHIKDIFAELFLYNFTVPKQISSPKTWEQFLSTAASLLISTDGLLDAIKTLYINITINEKADPLPAHIAERGYRVYGSNFNPANTFSDTGFMHNVLASDHASKLSLQDNAFKSLDRILAIAHQHGIRLHLIITPNYPWDDYRLITLGYWPLLEKWLRKVATYPDVVSFSQYNNLLEEAPTREPKMKWWNDPLHFSLNMGQKMLKAYLGHPDKETPKNFMRPLNSKTVESILAERHAGVLRWAKAHPDFVRNFEVSKTQEGASVG